VTDLQEAHFVFSTRKPSPCVLACLAQKRVGDAGSPVEGSPDGTRAGSWVLPIFLVEFGGKWRRSVIARWRTPGLSVVLHPMGCKTLRGRPAAVQ
jgi:hypothetical protein